MHPISSTLALMVERSASKARHSATLYGDPQEFERLVYHALAELSRTRPRLVIFAPAKALKRVLAQRDVRQYLGTHQVQPAYGNSSIARTPRNAAWPSALLIVATGLLLVTPELSVDSTAEAKSKLKTVTRTATVAESGGIDVDSNGAAITGGSFVFADVAKMRRIDQLTLTVTIGDGDTGPGDPKENLLHLALDGIDTGIALNGFRDSQTDTLAISGVPANAGQILAALKADGRLDATIDDIDPNGNGVTLPGNASTTLVIKGKQKARKR